MFPGTYSPASASAQICCRLGTTSLMLKLAQILKAGIPSPISPKDCIHYACFDLALHAAAGLSSMQSTVAMATFRWKHGQKKVGNVTLIIYGG